ncbi:MAG: hypothetical protein HOD85_14410 [Deltaproteobacteria bacterium]|jgi:hypothetical protein|nr:hypothetical protein [Deltaproteobacteria bacterium]MBT4638739.1 hypothetical protein [Deltaproteobacteria bacterium]
MTKGGARPGAGRKKGDPTKLMRIPIKYEQQVKDLIKKLKSEAPPAGLERIILNALVSNERSFIRDLKSQVDAPAASIDEKLKELQIAGKIALDPMDDPEEITEADRKTAVMIGGEPQSIIYKLVD